jgi:GT2 family glycosyltransferase
MKISVVIPAYNAAGSITACLISLFKQSLMPFEIIVVNNNSTDNTKDLVLQILNDQNDISVCCLDENRQGPSYARNCGANKAGGDIVAFIDADCIADSSWLARLSESFESSDIGAVAGSIIGFDKETTIGKFHALFTMKDLSESRMFHEFDLVSGGFPTANLSIRKQVLEAIGGFDETLPIYSEDYDLCARIYKAGLGIYYNKEVKVFHKHRQNLRSTWRQSYGFGTGHAALLKKHFHKILIIEIPRWRYISTRWPLLAWVDIASADKKFILCLILSGIWSPFSLVLILYLILLYRNMGGRMKKNHIVADFGERWSLVFLLLFKSMAITFGRLRGSFVHRVLCF